MRPSQLIRILPTVIGLRRPMFIKGAVGVGKSSIVAEAAKEMGIEIRDVRLSQMDPTDIKGFPSPDAKKGVMRWLPPNFLPTDPNSKGVLFMDEANSAPPAVQAACYQLTLDFKVGDYVLPEGWSIVLAGNRDIDRSIVQRTPAALNNRLIHVELETDVDDWTEWALNNNISPELIAFLRRRGAMLHTFDPKSTEAAFATPRTWAFADQLARSGLPDKDLGPLLEGTVGVGPTGEFLAFRRLANKLPSIEEILMAPEATEVPTEPDLQYAITTMCATGVKSEDGFKALLTYMNRVSPELQVVFIRDVLSQKEIKPMVSNTRAFVEWSTKNAHYLN